MNFREYFRLKENPFGESPDLRFFFPSRAQQEALRKASWAVEENKSFLILTGETGSGKTLFSRMLHASLEEETNTALIVNPLRSTGDLFSAICRDFGLDSELTLDHFSDWLILEAAKGRKNLLIIDEAQALPYECLEFIRLLTNLETATGKLLQILLIGQPELESRLAGEELRQLRQRVFLQMRLGNLDLGETAGYIRHRIEKAGGGNFVRFDESAVKAIHSLSGGSPRLINKIAEAALRFAALEESRRITGSLIRRLPFREIGFQGRPSGFFGRFRRLELP